MAYLDNSSITVDAVLTKKGRELLADGGLDFKITKFCLSDDEVDYSLWNPLHPSGSDYYGKIIENMPVLEALIDESQAMRYKLISIDDVLSTATTVNLPYITLNLSPAVLGTVTNGTTINIELGDSPKNIVFSPRTYMTSNGFTQDSGLDDSYTYIINKSSNDIINESKGMFTDISAQIQVNSGMGVVGTTSVFSGDGDFTAITRVARLMTISVNSAGTVTENNEFRLPITIIGNTTGTMFNIILSFIIPASLTSIIGSGLSKSSGNVSV